MERIEVKGGEGNSVAVEVGFCVFFFLQCIEATSKPQPPPPLHGLRYGLHTLVHACLDPPTFTLTHADWGVVLATQSLGC